MAGSSRGFVKGLYTLRRVTLWLLAGIVLLIAALAVLNAFDEPPSPQAQRLLLAPPNPWSADRNLYVAMMGLDALPERSTIAAGEARIAAIDADTERFAKDRQAALASLEKGRDTRQRLAFDGQVDFCDPLVASCWQGAEKHREEIAGLVARNQVLYGRYGALWRVPGYYETAKLGIFTPPVDYPSALHKLFLADIALRVRGARTADSTAAALKDLGDDIAMWRRMLAGNGTLVSKMLAIASLHGDFALLGDVVADPAVDVEGADARIASVLDGFRDTDWTANGMFGAEFRMTDSAFEQHRRQSDERDPEALAPGEESRTWWSAATDKIDAHFFKLGATQNLNARMMIELERLGAASASDFPAARRAYDAWVEANLTPHLSWAYNPLGRLSAAIPAGVYPDYLLRIHDVEALLRLVRLGHEVREARLRNADVEAFMAAHPQWSTHPVSRERFRFDAGKGEITMHPLGNAPPGRRFTLPVLTLDGARR